MNKTAIQWTDYTSNPIKYIHGPSGQSVWACVKVSDGCKNCYAEALAVRYGRGGPFTVGQMAQVTPYLDEAELKALLSVKRLSPGSKVFIGDMTDIFGEWVPDEMLDRLFAVFALRPDVVFQLLTKRPERMRAYLGDEEARVRMIRACMDWADSGTPAMQALLARDGWPALHADNWPPPNVWLGTSVEDQEAADKRIPELLATPAAVRYLSVEPLLEAVELERLLHDSDCVAINDTDPLLCACYCNEPREDHISWVIVGGESGPKARPCDVGWIRSIVSQCQAAAVAVFVKQLGSKPVIDYRGADMTSAWSVARIMRSGDPLVGLRLKSSHGSDPAEWPEDLRVREFPLHGYGFECAPGCPGCPNCDVLP